MDEHHWYVKFWTVGARGGDWGLAVCVDGLFIKTAKGMAQDPEVIETMTDHANYVVNRGWPIDPPSTLHRARLLWHPSCGLQAISVPGNACDLGIDGFDLGHDLEADGAEYGPHNIDSPLQQSLLFKIWHSWANSVEARIAKSVED